MFCCETAGTGAQEVEDLAVFVSQLTALGVNARIHVRSVPEELNRNAQFDLAPFLFDDALGPEDRVVLVGAQRLADQRLAQLRRLAGASDRKCIAFGTFENRQAIIGAKAKLSYVFGRDPQVCNVAASSPGEAPAGFDAPVFGVARRSDPQDLPRLLIIAPDVRGAGAAALIALSLSQRFSVAVLTDGKSKQAWRDAHGADIAFFQYGEILPADLAGRFEICVRFAPAPGNYRLRCLIANLAVSGAALIDSTSDHAVARRVDSFIRGPIDLLTLAPFLESEILPNLEEIAAHARASHAASRESAGAVLRLLDTAPSARSPTRRRGPTRVVFTPTNGVGLGHAQRCALVAAEIDAQRVTPVFAAFPSCVGLVKSYGFDAMPLIGRSAHHAQSHENDIVNYLRLRALTDEARILVFDGGYVFDSVFRTIVENYLTGIWIRRGLWQTGQDNSLALDREKAFARVIVPIEAFEELNASYSLGRHLRAVGPIVQRIGHSPEQRRALRGRLAERFGRPFGKLVVSLLGAGVAADRGAQIQALCGMMERRADTLHLVVVWPTATTQPAWFGWSNSRVVKTNHAGVIAAAADLCVSAAGYNSFHESLYNAIPTIFVPQTGSFMDDQKARAIAARDRGVAGTVDPHELMTLERETCRFLDEGKAEAVRAAIAALDLPEPGNARTARLIEEFTDGYPALECDSVADRPAGSR